MKKLNLKTLILSFLTAIIMLLPFTMSAQRSDGFFKANEGDDYQSRDASIGMGLSNDSFGQAPLGTGLLVMVAAGAGYALLKRKRSYKTCRSYKTYMLALAMVLTLTGCKKKIEPIVNSGETVHITLNVGNGNRHIIEPNESGCVPVSYSAGDVIYVGNGSTYIGTLSYVREQGNVAIFEGDVNPAPNPGNMLHFYFIGGLDPSVTPEKGTTTDFTVNISQQRVSLPVLSYGVAEYNENNISCTLENKCALVEFKMTSPQENAVRIANMLSQARINFGTSTPGITPTGVLDAITLYDQSTINKWAILLPGDERTSEAIVYTAFVEPNTNLASHEYYDISNIGPLSAGDYIYGKDHAITINNDGSNTSEKKFFVVSANGNVVQFSNGNLLYKAYPTPTWHIADNPWDFVGGTVTYNTSITADFGTVYVDDNRCSNTKIRCTNNRIGDSSYEGYIDLYGWSTWGPGGNPWQYLTTDTYAWSTDFNGTIDNDTLTDWRVLTKEEWEQLKTYHNTSRIGLVTLHGEDHDDVRGAILLPDKCESVYNPDSWSDMNDDTWNSWKNQGAVFLPATGYRQVQTVNQANQTGQKTSGYYWTSSSNSSDDSKGVCMYITSKTKMNTNSNFGKSYGMAVRLVR